MVARGCFDIQFGTDLAVEAPFTRGGEAGRKPGQDVTLVSIDGENAAMDAIVAGKLGASVESSPFFGPISYETMMKYVNGEDLPDWVVVKDRFFDSSNAKDFVGKQF